MLAAPRTSLSNFFPVYSPLFRRLACPLHVLNANLAKVCGGVGCVAVHGRSILLQVPSPSPAHI